MREIAAPPPRIDGPSPGPAILFPLSTKVRPRPFTPVDPLQK